MSGTTPLIVVGTRTGALHLYSDDLLVPRHQSVHREGQNTQTWNALYTANQAGDAIITDIGYKFIYIYILFILPSTLFWVILYRLY